MDYETALYDLRELVRAQVVPLATHQERWDKLRKLVVEHKMTSEEFTHLANDINLFPKENEV